MQVAVWGQQQKAYLSWKIALPTTVPLILMSARPATDLHTQPGDVLIATHKELEGRTKTGLAQATAKASEHAAEQDGATNLTHSGKLRDLASAAARVFGWDSDKPDVQFNQLIVTQEQLEQIRALRDS